LVFENLSIKNPLISFLKKNKEMEYKKKNFKKIVYQQVFVKKFFEELSRGLTNYSYKKPVKKLNKDEKEHLKLISYKKLKLLNKLEIFTKLIFLKKEYLN